MNEAEVYQVLEEGLSIFKGVFEENDFMADFRPSLSDVINDCRIIDYDAIDKLREALKPVNECLESLKTKPAEMSDYAKESYLERRAELKDALEKIKTLNSADISRSENENYVELTLSVPQFDDLTMSFEKRTNKLIFTTDYDSDFPFKKEEVERVLKETAEKYGATVEHMPTCVLETKGDNPTEEEIKTLAIAGIEGLINLSPLKYNGVERKFYREDVY